jgi:hypothetical protein
MQISSTLLRLVFCGEILEKRFERIQFGLFLDRPAYLLRRTRSSP